MRSFALTLGVLLSLAASAHGTLVITFTDGDDWDGAVANDTIGPLADPMTSLSATATIDSVTGNGANPSLSFGNVTTAAPLGFGLGVTSDSDVAPFLMNVGESFSMSWDTPTEFAGISFRANFGLATTGAQAGQAETITVSSTAWQSLSITPTDPFVSFDSGTGTFTFTADDASVAGGTNQDIDAVGLGGAVPVPAGVSISFAKIGVDIPLTGTTAGAGINAMSYNVVPEASQLLLGSLVCGVFGLGYGRRKWLARKNASQVDA